MSVARPEIDDQLERTLLAWRRTAASLAAAGLLVAHLAAGQAGDGYLLATLVGTAVVVAHVWLSHQRQLAVTALVLVLGVLLLGVVTLLGILGG